jgi:hypothetical protein
MSRPGAAASSGVSQTPPSLAKFPYTAMTMLYCVQFVNHKLIELEKTIHRRFQLKSIRGDRYFSFFIKGGCAVNLQAWIYQRENWYDEIPADFKNFKDIDCSLLINPYLPEEVKGILYLELPAYVLKYIFDFLKSGLDWNSLRREWKRQILPQTPQDKFNIWSTPYWEDYENASGIRSFYETKDTLLANLPSLNLTPKDFQVGGACPFRVQYKTNLSFMSSNFHSSLISLFPAFESSESFLDITITKMNKENRLYDFDFGQFNSHPLVVKSGLPEIWLPIVNIIYLYIDQQYSAAHNTRTNKITSRLQRADYIKSFILDYYYKIYNYDPRSFLTLLASCVFYLNCYESPYIIENKDEYIRYLIHLGQEIRKNYSDPVRSVVMLGTATSAAVIDPYEIFPEMLRDNDFSDTLPPSLIKIYSPLPPLLSIDSKKNTSGGYNSRRQVHKTRRRIRRSRKTRVRRNRRT